MGGRCRRRGNATRHTDFVPEFRSIWRGVARRSSWMGVDEYHKPDPKLASEGDGDDGRGTTWRCGTRAVGNCRRMIAPVGPGRRALGLVPDHHHHHRSPCPPSSHSSSSRAAAVVGDAFECAFWSQFRILVPYKLLDSPLDLSSVRDSLARVVVTKTASVPHDSCSVVAIKYNELADW